MPLHRPVPAVPVPVPVSVTVPVAASSCPTRWTAICTTETWTWQRTACTLSPCPASPRWQCQWQRHPAVAVTVAAAVRGGGKCALWWRCWRTTTPLACSGSWNWRPKLSVSHGAPSATGSLSGLHPLHACCGVARHGCTAHAVQPCPAPPVHVPHVVCTPGTVARAAPLPATGTCSPEPPTLTPLPPP